ncbi:Methanogenesis regulatory histidine kinase FilI [uncultured archaeon]|nr:Methanogenesis regulatory histidine kinase FilI [uncultured archaeon]
MPFEILEPHNEEGLCRVLIENSIQGFLVILDGHIVYANKAASEIIGCAQEKLASLSLGELIAILDFDGHSQFLQDCQECLLGKRASFLRRFRIGNTIGKWRMIEALINPILYQERPALQMTCLDITMQAKAENQSSLYQLISSHARDIILLMHRNGKIIEANDAAVKAYGYSHEELASMRIGDLRDAETLSEMPQQMEQDCSRGILFETRHRRKDGSIFPVEVSSRGTIIWGERVLLSIIRDTSERKQSQEALLESENRYRAIFENTGAAALIVEDDTIISLVNSEAERLFGYTREEIEGQKSWTDFVLEEDLQKMLYFHRIRRTNPDSAPRRYEIRIRDKKGDPKNILLHVDLIPGTRRSVASVIDITDYKRAQEALIESEKRYRLLVDRSPDGIRIDCEGRVVFINETGAKILGASCPEEIVGMQVLDLMHPDFKQVSIARERIVAKEGMECPPVEEKVLRLDGKAVDIEAMVIPFGRYQEKPAVQVVFRDITDRKNAEAQLKSYSERLEYLVEERTRQLRDTERLAAVGETAVMIGHDLRNPLQAIVTTLFLAKAKLRNLSSLELGADMLGLMEDLSTIERQSVYMNKIVCDLQDYARPLSPELADLNILSFIKNILSGMGGAKNIEVQIECDAQWTCRADPTMMGRILTNLINNSFQAMTDGGKMSITVSQSKDHVIMSLKDNGTGIPPEVRPEIFKPLVTSKAKGMGMGLVVCKRLLQALGGDIRIESEYGRGTEVIIRIPRAEESS